MLLKQETIRAIANGHVTLAFRRWKRPTVQAAWPGRTRAADLAAGLGVEKDRFKANVRKLKGLG